MSKVQLALAGLLVLNMLGCGDDNDHDKDLFSRWTIVEDESKNIDDESATLDFSNAHFEEDYNTVNGPKDTLMLIPIAKPQPQPQPSEPSEGDKPAKEPVGPFAGGQTLTIKGSQTEGMITIRSAETLLKMRYTNMRGRLTMCGPMFVFKNSCFQFE